MLYGAHPPVVVRYRLGMCNACSIVAPPGCWQIDLPTLGRNYLSRLLPRLLIVVVRRCRIHDSTTRIPYDIDQTQHAVDEQQQSDDPP